LYIVVLGSLAHAEYFSHTLWSHFFCDAYFREVLLINTICLTKYFPQAVGTICILGVTRDAKAPVPVALVSAATTK
jgi:hypothetical protein